MNKNTFYTINYYGERRGKFTSIEAAKQYAREHYNRPEEVEIEPMKKQTFYLVWTIREQLDSKTLKEAQDFLATVNDEKGEFVINAAQNTPRAGIKVDLVIE